MDIFDIYDLRGCMQKEASNYDSRYVVDNPSSCYYNPGCLEADIEYTFLIDNENVKRRVESINYDADHDHPDNAKCIFQPINEITWEGVDLFSDKTKSGTPLNDNAYEYSFLLTSPWINPVGSSEIWLTVTTQNI